MAYLHSMHDGRFVIGTSQGFIQIDKEEFRSAKIVMRIHAPDGRHSFLHGSIEELQTALDLLRNALTADTIDATDSPLEPIGND